MALVAGLLTSPAQSSTSLRASKPADEPTRFFLDYLCVRQCIAADFSTERVVRAIATIGIMPPGGSAGATALQGITLSLATPLLLLGADIMGALEFGCLHSYEALNTDLISAAAGAAVALVGRSEGGKTLSRGAVASVAGSVERYFRADSPVAGAGRMRRPPAKRSLGCSSLLYA